MIAETIWGVRLPSAVIECADQGEAERLAETTNGEVVSCQQVTLGNLTAADTTKACA